MITKERKQTQGQIAFGELNIKDTTLPNRARRWLQDAGIHTIGQLVQRTEEDLLSIRNFADTSLRHVKDFLDEKGLALQPPRQVKCNAPVIRDALKISPCGLSHREREILKLRHGIDCDKPLTLEETGAVFKLTRERVRQIQKKAEDKVIACVTFLHPQKD
ncbi:MAG: sigma factor-like helix-turn-helix DNA-binding protein [Planctomycetota bacterium]|jgi:DNA-directed RNA polymerase sigma subunit (sigma70/sigma32)